LDGSAALDFAVPRTWSLVEDVMYEWYDIPSWIGSSSPS
jgi:hypothetical protein